MMTKQPIPVFTRAELLADLEDQHKKHRTR